MSEIIRAFIALPLPQEIMTHLQNIQNKLKQTGFRMRWVRPENVHLTLKFLGEISSGRIKNIIEAMDYTAQKAAPFSLKAKGIGVFPNIRRVRVLWAGLRGETYELIQMQQVLDEQLELIGFEKESRTFKAHLTIARAKTSPDPQSLVRAIEQLSAFKTELFSIKKMVLYQSRLNPSGAVYNKLHCTKLG